MSTTSNRTATGLTTRGRYVLASRPLARWRTIDLVVTAFLGVAFGLAYWAWGIAVFFGGATSSSSSAGSSSGAPARRSSPRPSPPSSR